MKIEFEPLPPGSGFEFENDVVGGTVPKEFIPAVEKGLKAQKESGLLAGFPVIDFKATLIDGKYHEVDSNALTFEIAARAAFRELASRGGVVKLLEPIMKVEVVTPEDYLGGVIGDLNSRRGQVQGTGHARQRAGHHRHGAARQHVRLHQHAALDVARAARSTRWNSIITSRCRKRSRMKSKPNTPELIVRLRREYHGQSRNLNGPSRIAMWARSATSTTARRR